MTLKHWLKKNLSKIVKPVYGGIGHILMFHRVTPTPPARVAGQSRLEITPQRLEEIIGFFQTRQYDFIALNNLPTRLLQPVSLAGKARKFVVFTFDDGYADNLEHAYPIFKKHQVPFAIYVAASFPQREAVLWWYLLDDLILANDQLAFEFPDAPLSLETRTTQQKMQASGLLRARLKFAAKQDFSALLNAIFTRHGLDLYAKTDQLALSWDQIRQLIQDPLVTIGSHSLHHFPLKNLSEAEARDEIVSSKLLIEQKLGLPVDHFAYPFGEWREAGPREFELVRQSGYKTAVTTRFANIFPAHARHMEALPRFNAPSLTDQDWVLAVNGLLQLRRNRVKRIVTE